MVHDTDKVLKQVIATNPGIPLEQESYVYCNNKKPVHKGNKDLTKKPGNNFNSIAIRTNECDYMCLDFDGYSDASDEVTFKQEKQATAEKIKNNFITLLDKRTNKYRIDKTASNKYHVWLKHPNVPNKEFLKLPKFITNDGKATINGIVEIFSKFTKHNVHLAGSTLTENDKIIGAYENVYAGATFDELESIDDVTALLISAITSAGYYVKIEQADKKSNTIKYPFMDATHNGIIKRVTRNGNYYFSYLENEIVVSKNFYVTDKNNFCIDHIMADCSDEFKSIVTSIYYYHVSNTDATDNDSVMAINQEIGKQLIEVYTKYWSNTKGSRHYLLLATSHVLVKYLSFNESDLLYFFDELSDSVDEIDDAHRNVILEGLKPGAIKEYGIPTIIDILQCNKQELSFLSKNNVSVQNEFTHLEKIKPTITDELKENEKLFQEMHRLQQERYFDGFNSYIKIKPTSSMTSLITQTIGNTLLNENRNIARLFLALVTAIIGNGRTFIIVTGVTSGGKSAVVEAVKPAIPGNYILDLDDSSDKAFVRYVENKGKDAYDRLIIDVGDKGNIKGFEEIKERMGAYQSLITKGTYTYQVTNKENGDVKGTIDLTIKTDGFAEIITTTKDAVANFDEQLITRSQILNVADNTYDKISDFQGELGKEQVKLEVEQYMPLIQSHILYNLSMHDNLDAIIVAHWRDYINDLLQANNGVNREIEYTMNVFKTYCWVEIDRLKQIKGVDGMTYYIPGTAILCEFIKLYGVKSSLLNDIDLKFIKWLKEVKESENANKSIYAPIDTFIDDGTDLNIQSNRQEKNIFTYKDIESLLKSKNPELYKKINNVSDVLRKLEKSRILSRLADNTKKGNVLYYIQKNKDNLEKTFKLLPISDDNVIYALNHLREHERISRDNKKIDFKKPPKKFADYIDFSFIDQRANKILFPKKDRNDDNDNDDGTNDTGATIDAEIIAPVTNDTTQSDVSNTNHQANIDEQTTSCELVNLHCHTDESVGDGAISIEKLIDTAVQHNQKAIALTNHGTLNGLYKFNNLCRKKGIKAILGIEAYISENRYHLILLARNYQGYQDLLKLHNKNVEYMKAHGLKRNDKYVNGGIYYSNLEKDKDLCKNLIGLSGCISGEIPTLLLNGKYEQAKALAIHYNTIFNKFYLELQYNGLKEQEKLNDMLIELSNDTGIPLTVTGDVHYITNKDDWNAIKYAHRKGSHAPASNNAFMTTAPKQLAETTINIADSIATYNIETSLHIPKPEHSRQWLKTYCYERLNELNINDAEHRQRLEQELSVIKDEIADYHILLYEIVETIKDVAGVPGGRGSAVGSLVCYLLGFHEVDPIKYGLLFERFLNTERIQQAILSDTIDTSLLPDIDLNIADDKKDEVFAVLEKEYQHIAKVMTYSRLKADNKTIEKIKTEYPTADIIDLKYNLSVHAGGIILSTESFNQYLPVTLTKDNEIVSDCDLAEIESRGGIKYDLLGESSSKINKGIKIKDKEIKGLVNYIVQHPIGISQFTGSTARNYLREHKDEIKTFDDLLEATALIRTGSNESWIFQEDMMQEAVKYGVTMADADYLRKPRGNEQEKQEKLDNIIATMKSNGCTSWDAELFRNYHNNYSFNKSHAVAYTLESLKNAKLKKTYTALFFEKKLNHAKDSITIAELFDDAIKLGVKIIAPGYEYYKLDAKADGNKLYVGSKFIKGISSKEPIMKGKFNKTYKDYLNKSNVERLYSIGAYDKRKLPKKNIISLGFKTVKDYVIVATISADGYANMWFEKSKYYKPNTLFDKGNVISDEIIEQYASY